MNSRQRLLAALKHQEPDRVPIDFDGMRSSGIHAIAYNRLKAYLGAADGQTMVYDVWQQLAHPEEAVLERFGVDVRPLTRAPLGMDPAQPGWQPWTLPDGSPALVPSGLDPVRSPEGDLLILGDDGTVEYRMPASALYFEPVSSPLAGATTAAEIEAYEIAPIPDVELAWLEDEARRLRTGVGADKAIMGQTGLNVYEGAQRLRGWERFMLDLAWEPKLVQALLQKLADFACEQLDRWLAVAGDHVDIVQMGDDLGTQGGPQLSPAMYRRLVKPYQAQVWQHARRRSGLPLFLHCCGGIYPLLPDLIDAGVDIINPVQITAAGMDPARLKREFGRDLVFWGGGADTQQVLPNGTPAEVRDHVCGLIDIFAPGGGFVFNQVHNIQANVPPENVVAMFDAARECGRYTSYAS